MEPSGRGEVFEYVGYEFDPDALKLSCNYWLDGETFTEEITFLGGLPCQFSLAEPAFRLVFLLAGISYYKTRAPYRILFPQIGLSEAERQLIREFYLDGLGEFAYRNGLDLSDLSFEFPDIIPDASRTYEPQVQGPLVPFGGGVDSIVSVELLRDVAPTLSLFVMNRPGDRFSAIEEPAKVTGYPITRAERALDPKLLETRERGYLNGHVPITGILSAIALTAAVLASRDAVIMSNEASASVGNVELDGHAINHQYSKSAAFEARLNEVMREYYQGSLEYFSVLRPASELWIARKFSEYSKYFDTFKSCNRVFQIDPQKRYATWCGECDKCCFIDLILAPFLSRDQLAKVFGGREPLQASALRQKFRTLLDTSGSAKPWECVGDVPECRTAAKLAARRSDRQSSIQLQELNAELDSIENNVDLEVNLLSISPTQSIPERYAPEDFMV